MPMSPDISILSMMKAVAPLRRPARHLAELSLCTRIVQSASAASFDTAPGIALPSRWAISPCFRAKLMRGARAALLTAWWRIAAHRAQTPAPDKALGMAIRRAISTYPLKP